MNETKMDELFNHKGAADDAGVAERIRTGIRNNIYRRAALVVLAAMVLVCLIRFGRDRIRENQSFHLSSWQSVVDEEYIKETAEKHQMNDTETMRDVLNAQAYISAYCSIFLPGIIPEFSEPDQSYANASPYGTYRIGGKLLNYFEVNPENEPYQINAEDNSSHIEVKDGRIQADQSANILNAGSPVLKNSNAYETYSGLQEGDFYSHFRNESTENKTQAYLKELEYLPNSAMVELDIRYDQPTTVYNLLRAGAGYENSRIVYAATEYFPKEDGFDECAIGFSLIGGNGPSVFEDGFDALEMDDTLRRDKSYFQQGMFYYNNRASFFGEPKETALHMEEMYRLQLEILMENHLLNEREERAADKALRNAEERGVEVIGCRLYASKKDAVRILQNESTQRSHIVAVRYSRFS